MKSERTVRPVARRAQCVWGATTIRYIRGPPSAFAWSAISNPLLLLLNDGATPEVHSRDVVQYPLFVSPHWQRRASPGVQSRLNHAQYAVSDANGPSVEMPFNSSAVVGSFASASEGVRGGAATIGFTSTDVAGEVLVFSRHPTDVTSTASTASDDSGHLLFAWMSMRSRRVAQP